MLSNEIINIISKNRMINEDSNNVEVNKENEFLSNYTFNPTCIHKIPDDIKRNTDGFLILDNTPFIFNTYSSDGHNKSFWLLLDNVSKIFLKKVPYKEICMELLFQELANALLIPSAKYDVVTINNEVYLASPSFIGDKDLIIDYYDINEKYYVDIEELIKQAKKIKQEQYVKKMLTIDLLTDNKDRFPHNFKAIIRKGKYIICPLFDNGLCGKYGKNNKRIIIPPAYKDSTEINDIISPLSHDKTLHKWYENIVLKQDASLFKNEIYRKKGICIDQDINDMFVENVNNGQSLIIKNL